MAEPLVAPADGPPGRHDDHVADAVVVVVDDKPENVALVRAILKRAGITRVHGVTDAGSAISTVRITNPDLILLDLHMPGMDGVDVLTSLQRLNGSDVYLPVLVLTADGTSHAKRRALAAGAHDFLAKPLDHAELLLRVSRLLETRALYVSLRAHNAELADAIRASVERDQREELEVQQHRGAIEAAVEGHGLHVVLQPIFELPRETTVGVEALARFTGAPPRTPDRWFADAYKIGLGPPLELAAVRRAVEHLPRLPPGCFLAVNASPLVAASAEFAEIVTAVPGSRLVVELTEHARIDDYGTLIPALDELRLQGVRIAVDDAGAGFASLQHVLQLRPEIVKLDTVFTRGIDADPVRRAMVAGFVGFARELGATIVAEGIEYADELTTLRRLGVQYGQGYHLARPDDPDSVLDSVRHRRRVGMPGRTAAMVAPDPASRTPNGSPNEEPRRVTPPTVLVVEDFAPLRELCLTVLRRAGHTPLAVPSADVAWELLREVPTIRVVIADLHMPGMRTGADLIRWIHEERPDITVIVATGGASDGVRMRPGDTLLSKPFDNADLIEAVDRALDRHHSE